MNKWLKLSKKRRIEILEQVNNRLGLPIQAVEKRLVGNNGTQSGFSHQDLQNISVFKGRNIFE